MISPAALPAVTNARVPAPRFGDNRNRDYEYLLDPERADRYATWKYQEIPGRKEPDAYVQELLGRYLKPGDTVLELGCNRGNNLLPLGGRFQAYGVDLVETLVDEAAFRAQRQGISGNVHVAQWDFAEDGRLPAEWPDLTGRCKAIYSVHVLSHFTDEALVETMQNMAAYLAPGGIFVATIIDPPTLKERLSVFRERISRLLLYAGISLLYDAFCLPQKVPSDTHAGYNTHRADVVDKAFKGLQLLESRKFSPGELKHWHLPERQLRWVVYQKPLDSGAADRR